MTAYPLPEFPGRTQEHILQQMLRTRLEPNVEEWVQQGQSIAQSASSPFSGELSDTDLNSFWKWVPESYSRIGKKQRWGKDFTLEEVRTGIESVETGLKRKLEEPEEHEIGPETEDDEMQTRVPLPGEEDDEADEESEDEEEEAERVEAYRKSDVLASGMSATPSVPPMPLDKILQFMMTGSVT